jgi:hypothetical protein
MAQLGPFGVVSVRPQTNDDVLAWRHRQPWPRMVDTGFDQLFGESLIGGFARH